MTRRIYFSSAFVLGRPDTFFCSTGIYECDAYWAFMRLELKPEKLTFKKSYCQDR